MHGVKTQPFGIGLIRQKMKQSNRISSAGKTHCDRIGC